MRHNLTKVENVIKTISKRYKKISVHHSRFSTYLAIVDKRGRYCLLRFSNHKAKNRFFKCKTFYYDQSQKEITKEVFKYLNNQNFWNLYKLDDHKIMIKLLKEEVYVKFGSGNNSKMIFHIDEGENYQSFNPFENQLLRGLYSKGLISNTDSDRKVYITENGFFIMHRANRFRRW